MLPICGQRRDPASGMFSLGSRGGGLFLNAERPAYLDDLRAPG